MACAGDIPAGDAIANVAFHRTRLLSNGRTAFLVACDSALAVGGTMAAVVDAPVSFPRHAAMRRPFRLARFLRSSRISFLCQYAANGRPLSSRRPAVRRCIDVDLCNRCISGDRNDSLDADALAGAQ